MMKNLLIILVISLLFQATAYGQTGFVLTGKLEGLENGKKVTLTLGATHKAEKPMFEATVINGKFTFKGKLEGPRLFRLAADSTTDYENLFLENAVMKLTGKVTFSSREGKNRAEFSDVQLTGSKSHEYYTEKRKLRSSLDKEFGANRQINKEILDSLNKYKRGSEEYKKLTESEAYKKMASDEKASFDKLDAGIKKLIRDNSKTFWGPFFMLSNWWYFTDREKPSYDSLSVAAKNSFYGKLVKDELYPASYVGKPAPQFTSADREGTKHALKELLGKYTILDFWASWCAPCRKEIPNLKKLYEKYHPIGLAIISISLDKEDPKWKKALDEENLPWANLLDREGVDKKYGIKTIPAMFVIDKNGKVIGEKLRGESLENKLKELFGE
jgi:thiol-disulfide isomerase/thioredoxin